MNENVPNIVQNVANFKTKYKEIVHELIKIRNEAGFTQQFLAKWLEIDRRKIIAFENLKKVNLEIMLKYAENLSVDVEIKFKIN